MKFHRIYSIIYRYVILTKRSLYRSFDIFYWPALEIILWGVTSLYIRQFTSGNFIIYSLLTGVIFWMLIQRTQNDLSVCVLEDLWNKNLINIFVSPLSFFEWMIGLLVFGIMKMGLVMVFSALISFLLYHFNVFLFGFYMIPFVLLLLLTGWWVGFLVNSLILRFGNKVGTAAWSAIFLISPFSAIYYPLSVLPSWAQTVAKFIPTSYLFEGAREVLLSGHLDPRKVYISFGLSLIYLVISAFLLRSSFKKLLDRGLVKIY